MFGRSLRATRDVLRIGFVLSVTRFTIPLVAFALALANAGAGFVGLLIGLFPLVTAILAAAVLPDEPMTLPKASGLLVALAGVSVLTITGDTGLAEGGKPILATALSMVGVLSISIGNVYGRQHAGEYEPLHITGLQLAFGAIGLTVLMFVIDGVPADISLPGWALIVYLAAVSTVLAMFLLFWLISTTSATTASLMGYLVPLIAVIGGVILLDEKLQRGIVIGGVLILTGVLLTEWGTERASV